MGRLLGIDTIHIFRTYVTSDIVHNSSRLAFRPRIPFLDVLRQRYSPYWRQKVNHENVKVNIYIVENQCFIIFVLITLRFKFLRRLSFWRYRRDYFPIRLVKTAELPPDTTYLFPSFPHGILVFGATTNFGSNVNHFDEAYPGLNPYLMTLNVNLNWPFTRELLLGLGKWCTCG